MEVPMTIQVSPTETQTWIRTRDNRTGRQLAVAVPSKSQAGKYHLVTMAHCDCKGFAYRGSCAHLTAVLAEVAKLGADAALAEVAAERWCELCRRYEACHCDRMQATCSTCRPPSCDLADGGKAHLAVLKASGSWS
jgi:hypothetical protein